MQCYKMFDCVKDIAELKYKCRCMHLFLKLPNLNPAGLYILNTFCKHVR